MSLIILTDCIIHSGQNTRFDSRYDEPKVCEVKIKLVCSFIANEGSQDEHIDTYIDTYAYTYVK
jgi:hypothetical protein